MLGWLSIFIIESSLFYHLNVRNQTHFVILVLKNLLHSNDSSCTILLSFVNDSESSFPNRLYYGVSGGAFLTSRLDVTQCNNRPTFALIGLSSYNNEE